ncbi:hypothetical protein ACJJTC_008091 [Scirpophaga incertulas]
MDEDNIKRFKDMDECTRKSLSMTNLIMWNIFKIQKLNPSIDLKAALQEMQEKIDNIDDLESWQNPEQQHMYCAVLAWRQLDHKQTVSLYEFVQAKLNDKKNEEETRLFVEMKDIEVENCKVNCPGTSKRQSKARPVVILPLDTRNVALRIDKDRQQAPAKKTTLNKNLRDKIDAACCMETACLDRLSKLDKATTELRLRAQRLARREAERIEHLERAEAAWRDLEIGFQRRLAISGEKEEAMMKHIKKMIEERNGHKSACTGLAQELRAIAEVVEKDRVQLTEVEKVNGASMCERLRLSEEVSHLDNKQAELQCFLAQLDRDLQFKQEQVRRKVQRAQIDADCARVMSYEAERTMHAELTSLRDQITSISTQLLKQDTENAAVQAELEELRQQKAEIIEDLEKCQQMCKNSIQAKFDEINTKRDQIKELKDKVMECKCKLHVDVAIEVKRTPSLVVACKCAPDEKLPDNCSCTSLRSTLLSNLLSDLFEGLQAEMVGCSMPCMLLKCLEDKHNWDQSSVIKTNLQNYFSKIVVGELEIAIATSIEKYHARWVGSSCVDALRRKKSSGVLRAGSECSGGQDRAVERRAQELATKLAEKLFQERAEQLTAKAKEVFKSGPPPCKCRPSSAAVYPCFVKTIIPAVQTGTKEVTAIDYWRRTHRNVTLLRAQLEDLKKDSVKKEDLKNMEQNIVKIVQLSVPDSNTNLTGTTKYVEKKNKDIKNITLLRSMNFQSVKNTVNKLKNVSKKCNVSYPKKVNSHYIVGFQVNKSVRHFKKMGRTYAANLCLTNQNRNIKILQDQVVNKINEGNKCLTTCVFSKKNNNAKDTKPIITDSIELRKKKKCKIITHPACDSALACFHKSPSNTSLEKLLQYLVQFKRDLVKINSEFEKNQNNNIDDLNLNSKGNKNIRNSTKIGKPIVTKYDSTSIKQTDLNVTNTEDPCISGCTESIYMGAINLDKSNDNYCECQNDQTKFQNQLINSRTCLCNSKITKDISDINNSHVKRILDEHNNESIKFKSSKDLISQLPMVTESDSNTNDKNNGNPLTENATIKDTNRNMKSLSPCTNEEYCIKFLGVTLTNEKLVKKTADESKNDVKLLKQTFGIPNSSDIIKQSDILSNYEDNKKKDIDENCNLHNTFVCESHMKLCNLGENCKHIISLDKIESKHQGDFFHKETVNYNSQQSCVCCDGTNSEEIVDLEHNAFNLLQTHLRERLDNLKTLSQIDSLTSQEEETLFSTILERVKQIIKQNTSDLSCRCIKTPQNGSWQRAYVLLQEYLRMKMKKIQCFCASSDRNKTVLPDIMGKICNSIESDFDRLKNICQNLPNNQNIKSDLPERDGHFFYNHTKNHNDTREENIEFSEHIVSQMPFSKFDKSTKSCDVLKAGSRKISMNSGINDKNHDEVFTCTSINDMIENKCIGTKVKSLNKSLNLNCKENTCFQVLDKDSGNKNHVPYLGCTINCTCDENTNSTTCPKFIALKNGENINNIWKNITQKAISNNLSYMMQTVIPRNNHVAGYTIDCSCDGPPESCICAKSSILKNRDNIYSMWKEITNKKLQNNNLSYIMENVSHKKYIDNDTKKCMRKTNAVADKCVSDANTCIHEEDNIILKDSIDKIGKTFESSGTSFTENEVKGKKPLNRCYKSVANLSNNYDQDNSLNNVINMNPQGDNVHLKSNLIPLGGPLSSSCECNMVPLCHVKMLVNNIENKLLCSKCTCDSMCPKVCPLHSNNNNTTI